MTFTANTRFIPGQQDVHLAVEPFWDVTAALLIYLSHDSFDVTASVKSPGHPSGAATLPFAADSRMGGRGGGGVLFFSDGDAWTHVVNDNDGR